MNNSNPLDFNQMTEIQQKDVLNIAELIETFTKDLEKELDPTDYQNAPNLFITIVMSVCSMITSQHVVTISKIFNVPIDVLISDHTDNLKKACECVEEPKELQ